MFDHIKETDLNFSGISRSFAASCSGAPRDPTGEDVSASSYERPDTIIRLLDGRVVHAVSTGRNTIKLTLLDDSGRAGVELGWVGIETMRLAVERGFLQVDGNCFFLAKINRQLKRMLARATFRMVSC